LIYARVAGQRPDEDPQQPVARRAVGIEFSCRVWSRARRI
jgi:hypothetical protein